MSQIAVSYSVLLLPRYEVVAHGLTLREATAWANTYNESLQGEPSRAMVVTESPQPQILNKPAA